VQRVVAQLPWLSITLLRCHGSQSHTLSMKTAISIPDRVFRDAERLAERLKKSRSQMYSEAVADYVIRHEPDSVTEQINAVCAPESTLDPIRSLRPLRGKSSNTPNGNFSRRHLMGGSAGGLAALPGNVLLPSASTGLPKDSVANVTQVIAVDQSLLTERIGRISRYLELLWKGLDLLLTVKPVAPTFAKQCGRCPHHLSGGPPRVRLCFRPHV
jgi:hypothetical protein